MGKGVLILTLATALFVGCKRQKPAPTAQTASNTASVISGRVLFKGTAPPPRTLPVDPLCGKQHSVPPTESDFNVGPSNGLAEVLVYLKGLPAEPNQQPSPETPVLDQKGCVYAPRVFGVMVNQKFKIRNSDPFLHNVHAQPKSNKEFNFAQVVQGQVNEKAFTAPEVLLRIKCDVHPWMNAYVGVFEHRFFAVTDSNGQFRLPGGVPAGKFTLEAAHPKGAIVSQEVTVAPGEHKQTELAISPK
jgi:hypothetical protein